jgi:hypothetical protein
MTRHPILSPGRRFASSEDAARTARLTLRREFCASENVGQSVTVDFCSGDAGDDR